MALFALILALTTTFYANTLQLGFLSEDYRTIDQLSIILSQSWRGPLWTASDVALRFRPVQFYTLALESKLFKSNIVLYRSLNLILLSVVAFLLFKFLREIVQVRMLPALAGALFAVFYFLRVDIVYFYCAQFYLLGEICFLVLLFAIFSTEHTIGHTGKVVALFVVALLTLDSTVIFVPLLLYRVVFARSPGNHATRAAAWIYVAALSLPPLLLLYVERRRSALPPVFATSIFRTAKNLIVLTGSLFYPFPPFGFTGKVQSTGWDWPDLLAFAWDHPGLPAMLILSGAISVAVAFLLWRGGESTRFLCVGLLLSVAVFVRYEPGTSARYLDLALLFLCGLGAHLYSSHFSPRSYWAGALLGCCLFAYNLALYARERQPYLDEIAYATRLRDEVRQYGRALSPADPHTVRAIARFWRLNGNGL